MENPPKKAKKREKKNEKWPHPSCSETRPQSIRPPPSSLRSAPKVSEHAPSGLTRETEKVRMEKPPKKAEKKSKKKSLLKDLKKEKS